MENFGLDPVSIRGKLIQSSGAYFEDRPNDLTICHIAGIKIYIRDIADLALAEEIFRGFSYPIPFKESCVVIDIGMNVGFAALDFARNPYVEAVYGFEPFSRTFEMATDNFNLNPDIAPKIRPFCFGLANIDETRNVEYSEIMRCGMTVRGIPDTSFSVGNILGDRIQLREISNVLGPIVEKNKGKKLILKMDCEGDEFDLIPRLDDSGLLDSFDLIMIEFHHQSPDELLKILVSRGYSHTDAITTEQILFQGKDGNMIYAAKDERLLGLSENENVTIDST